MHASHLTADPALTHRRASRVVRVLGPDGRPLPDADVVVEQTQHAFGFGCTGFDFVALANGEADTAEPPPFGGATPSSAAQLADLWLGLFDTATLPFYWGGFEPVRGRPDTARLRAAAQWFAARGVRLKGHPLVWHTVQPSWLLDLSVDEVEAVQRARIRREVGDFAGLIDTWDAINEVVIMPVFDKEDNGITRLAWVRGRVAMIRMAFDEARATNPRATLLLNDFDMSSAYECLIEAVLEAGIPVDGLGLQSHMHQGYWGEERTLRTLERFSRFGPPLHLTETTLLSGEIMPADIDDLNDYVVDTWPSTPEGEERQADELVRHYRTLLSHPAVVSTTYWGLPDEGAWLGAPAGLVRRDGTPKPAYDALRALVRGEWWLAPTTVRTDSGGCLSVEGFHGEYTVRAGGAAAGFTLDAASADVVDVRLV
ncbi:endo-1,4-beta-xylanase [Cellulomonas edaphi]|uniref:Beta-xylanase n=1 Tax=Cellulomonas edaphi TaxID=3053468 RepID=A0ABT7S9Q9_9CELL|nr:endo-1,4-beta-xylanase [Cellulomons edaphi]MDM7832349.1 endo-1,4-beta-xylanase [Cellulomons edaphi]